jgi:hypothetical protein
MNTSCIRWLLATGIVTLALATVSAGELRQYREFRLGSSLATVASLAGTLPSDLKTVHERPVLLRDLNWRPRYGLKRPIPDVDPVREVVFSFIDDELYRIAVDYDPARTAGLAAADIIAALSETYGPPDAPAASLVKAPTRQEEWLTTTVMAQWQRDDARVALRWSDYYQRFSLQVASSRLEELARTASAQAAAMDAREAPARDAARAKEQADAARAAAEVAGAANRVAFRP